MAKLIRQGDGLTKEGFIEFVEFDKNDRGKDIHMQPQVGFACIVDGRKLVYTWLTPVITELISPTEFKTKNSHYVIEYE